MWSTEQRVCRRRQDGGDAEPQRLRGGASAAGAARRRAARAARALSAVPLVRLALDRDADTHGGLRSERVVYSFVLK